MLFGEEDSQVHGPASADGDGVLHEAVDGDGEGGRLGSGLVQSAGSVIEFGLVNG
ncbi:MULTISPECIES: hypothetical protein [unclassified Streptomyces]|uniref:hypothetical protein n=1 Tax=unclassified Streptomyces TaxID=2593676 RepID=UPI0016510F68|nr:MULTISPECIES: hypothetical protein [unclassified Streptomyces]